MKVESVKPPKGAADPGTLHKKMMQLLSSLWVTHAIGTFARLGLADAMEAGADSAEAIAQPRGLITDRVYRLLRALSTCGIVTEGAGGKFALTPLGKMLTTNAPNSMKTSAERGYRDDAATQLVLAGSAEHPLSIAIADPL